MRRIRRYTFIITAKHAQCIILSGLDTIITARDSMQNPGHTGIFYKPGQTRLTRTKHDSVDPDDPTQFQPDKVYSYISL